MKFSRLGKSASGGARRSGNPAGEPPPFQDGAPVDRFCDLVLTGGVTSGVIYPSAVVELARDYRFKNIGGTSAGAMAAALAAAAEFTRRKKGSPAGFIGLAAVPKELAEEVDVGGTKRTRLLSLFQPTAGTARLFGVFVRLSNLTEGSSKRWALIRAFIAEYAAWVLLAALIALLIGVVLQSLVGWGLSIQSAVVWALAALLFVAVAIYLVWYRVFTDVEKGLVPNGYGLCKGSESKSNEMPALTDWLHQGIQKIAGLPDDAPLTFGQLWDADKPPEWLKDSSMPWQAINLQMITSNLTHGRPYRLPHDGLTSRIFFTREDLDSYFPRKVIDFLWMNSVDYEPSAGEGPAKSPATERFRELPVDKLPVVVAARLSLSFPFLFSAVPLWAVDYEERDPAKRQLKKCWFSDGGICSNFPIHLFDAFLPRWPTFGINLGRKGPSQTEPTWLARFHDQGRGDIWNRFDDDPSPFTKQPRDPLTRIAGFAAAIITTAKDWNDITAMRMPAVRDRIVRVGFEEGEGELNVRLDGVEILRIANEYGAVAGRKLANKFVNRMQPGAASTAWRDHRWVRFNTLLASLRERVRALTASAELDRHTTPLSDQIADAFVSRPLDGTRTGEAPLNATQADALDGLLKALKTLEHEFDKFDAVQPFCPDPMPSLRTRPPV